jgi:two-component system, OmpR family, response regulator ArlR
LRVSSSEDSKRLINSIDVEHDGAAGLKRLLEDGYDLLILDVMLPRPHGLSLMKEIRQRQTTSRCFC